MKKQIITLTVVMFACAMISNAYGLKTKGRVHTREGKSSHQPSVTVYRTGIERLIEGRDGLVLSPQRPMTLQQVKALTEAVERAESFKRGNPLRSGEGAAQEARQKYGAKTPVAKLLAQRTKDWEVTKEQGQDIDGAPESVPEVTYVLQQPGVSVKEVTVHNMAQERAKWLPTHTLRLGSKITVSDGNGGFVHSTYLMRDMKLEMPESPTRSPVYP